MRSRTVGLAGLILASLWLYTYKLDRIPSGFYIDEALPGYSAYSLLLTGHDEYGKAWPIAMRFYGSFNPPLYTFFTVLWVKLMGLTVTAVRMTAAISGVIGVVVCWSFLRKLGLFKMERSWWIGAVMFAISPWVVFYSRVGYETNLAFVIFSLGVLWLWMGLGKPMWIIGGMMMLSLSTYGAYAERLVVPIFIGGWLLISGKRYLTSRYRWYFAVGVLITLVMQIPHFQIMQTSAFFPKSNLLYDQAVWDQASRWGEFIPRKLATFVVLGKEFFSHYADYFSLRSLFFLPEPDLQRSIPDLAAFYPWMSVSFVVGLYVLFKKRSEEGAKYLWWLLAVTPFAAALTRDPFSTHRAMPMVLPMIVVISLGMEAIISIVRPGISPIFLGGLFAISLLMLWRSYFVLMPNERARVWGYGYEQLAMEIRNKSSEQFVIDQSRIKPSYVQLAFFLKFPPREFQKIVDPGIKENYYSRIEFDPYFKFANLETRNIDWQRDIYEEQILVGDGLAISEDQIREHKLLKLFEIRDFVGEVVFGGYRTNPREKCRGNETREIKCRKYI